MKNLSVALFLLFLGLAACKKDNSTHNEVNGVLTGPDPGACACCGGTLLKIADSTYRLYSIPPELNGPYPINVALTFTPLSLCPGYNYIKSDDIHRR